MSVVSVPCAVCGGADFAPVYSGTIDDYERDPASYFSSSRRNAGYMPIVRCRSCGLVLSNPQDSLETLARVYGEQTDHVYDSEDANRVLDADAHLAFVMKHGKPPGRLLDVGCATGIFVGRAADAGFDASGFDASRWSVERARQRAPHARFEAGTIETVSFADHSFDVISLWDVLEHVHSPRDVLTRVRRWLKPGGTVVLSMPNSASPIAKAMGKRWVLLLREHLWYFSPETLGRVLSQAGFELTDTREKWVSFSLANVAGRLSQYPGPLAASAARAAASPTLRGISVRFPMGEMDVAARAI